MNESEIGKATRRSKKASTAAQWANYQVVCTLNDTNGDVWVEVCDGSSNAYAPRAEFIGDATAAFKRLERRGIAVTSRQCQAHIRDQVQKAKNFDKNAIVAVRPGWCGSAYVMPNGTVVRPTRTESSKVIVAFGVNPKCKKSGGGVKDYVKAFEPIVKSQSLLLTSILLSLTGPLMNLVTETKWSVGNTGFDIVGPPNCGKTQNLAGACATWGDDPHMKRGYADAWSGTIAATMERVRCCNDGFIGLDETSTSTLKGANKVGTAADLANKVMMLSEGAERSRYGDSLVPRASRYVYLSTGNSALVDALDGHQDVIDAHSSRLITLRLELLGGHGIFDSIPRGFSTAAEAGNALDEARKLCHGWLGQEFVAKLVENRANDEAGLVRRILAYMERFHKRIRERTDVPPMDRVWRPLALAYAAGRLAKDWNLLPKSWGSFLKATVRIHDLAMRSFETVAPADQAVDPFAILNAYLKNAPLKDIRKKKSTLSKKEVQCAPGFLSMTKTGQLEVLISAKKFCKVIPNSEIVLKTLKATHKLAFEEDKRAVYRSIRGSGKSERDRVYAIMVKRTKNSDGVWETQLA